MSLDFVIIISFAGIFVGIVLLLFSNDKKNISALYYLSNSYKEQKSKTILKLKKPYYETLDVVI
ncbi:hypothetical protein [Epilithonimonas hispanica]|uniref:Uncharacterized protein n=1 Tax=Epilithonimonas hispanica TaxID=358687 RepID=A0A3D9CLK2_9FLAO|nr:hypothetical protein [Epilithonimonas hispanica]REC66608.1 hypothetical protein DRF58_16540 [Epilithonimonas hispanica]